MRTWSRWLVAFVVGMAMATGATAQLTDDASNYGGTNAVWETGANEGDGFGAWTLNAGSGGTFLASSTEGDGTRTNDIDTAGQAFGVWNGGSNVTEAIRGFDTGVWGDGAVLTFDYSFRFDGGVRGVTLIDDGPTEIFFFAIAASGYSWTGGGTAPQTDWPGERQYGEILSFSFTQNGSDVDWSVNGIHPSSPSETGTVTNVVIDTFRVFNAAAEGGEGNNVYFNNLAVTAGTPPALQFVDGVAAPSETGDIAFTLERNDDGTTADTVDLSSDNETAVTVPASATFAALADQVSFTGTVVSVTNGPAVILASNTVTGSTATFTVTPVEPSLAIGGPFQVFELGTEQYTLTRTGAVGSNIVFSSSDTNVLTVPVSETFVGGETELTFDVDLVGFGSASIFATNTATGVSTDYGVTVEPPSLTLTGQSSVREGLTRTYTLTRVGPVADSVTLSNTAPLVLDVPTNAVFAVGEDTVTFGVEALAVGVGDISAGNVDATAGPLTVTVTETPTGTYDEGSFYSGTWTNGMNEGSGFGPWSFNHTQGTGAAGTFIGDPAAGDINGMDQESFGFFANPIGSGANAEVTRAFSNELAVGQTFSFQWGLNFDSNDESSNRGFNLLSGSNEVLNVNMGNSAVLTLTVDGSTTNLFEQFGTQAFTLNFEHESAGELRVYGTGRDGVETFDQTFTVAGVPDGFSFYFNATESGVDERQMYMNELQITGDPEPEGPVFDNFDVTIVGGVPNATVNLGVGVSGTTYTLYYTTDLTTDPIVWTQADQVVGDGSTEVELTDDDAGNTDAMRIYAYGVED